MSGLQEQALECSVTLAPNLNHRTLHPQETQTALAMCGAHYMTLSKLDTYAWPDVSEVKTPRSLTVALAVYLKEDA